MSGATNSHLPGESGEAWLSFDEAAMTLLRRGESPYALVVELTELADIYYEEEEEEARRHELRRGDV